MRLIAGIFFAFIAMASPRVSQGEPPQTMPLIVPSGEPLRLYLIRRVPKRLNAAVEARVLAPVYAFDRQVIPVGTTVFGHVSSVEPVSKQERAKAVLGGDFTPLRIAEVEFTSLLFPDGHKMTLGTIQSPGLNSIFPLKPPKKQTQSSQNNSGGVLGTGKQMVRSKIDDSVATIKSVPDMVRSPNLKDQVSEYVMSRGAPDASRFWIGSIAARYCGIVRFATRCRKHCSCQTTDRVGFSQFDNWGGSGCDAGGALIFRKP
jgi:hypothetical protein